MQTWVCEKRMRRLRRWLWEEKDALALIEELAVVDLLILFIDIPELLMTGSTAVPSIANVFGEFPEILLESLLTGTATAAAAAAAADKVFKEDNVGAEETADM